jgi:hypothetical protein
MARLQPAATTVDASMLRRVPENAVRPTTVCLEVDGDRFEHLLLLRGAHVLIIWPFPTPILPTRRPWFNHLAVSNTYFNYEAPMV